MPDHAPDPGEADPLDLHGVLPPTITAFDDDGAIDPETTADHARYVVDGGCHGVFALGTNGEFALLSGEERTRVVESVVGAVGDEVPVLAGVGEPDTRRTVRNAVAAVEAGADGLAVITPYYYPLDPDAAVDHYRRVTEAVDQPVYVYHIPSRTGNVLSRETFAEIAALDGVCGFKDSSGDVAWLGQVVATHPGLSALGGSDALLFANFEVGCTGVVSAVANVFPELVVELYDAYDAGDEERARDLQRVAYGVRDAMKKGPYLSGVKAALDLVGFDAGSLRDPLRDMTADERTTLEADLRELDLL